MMKPGERVKVIKGFYKGQSGVVMARGLWGWSYTLTLDEMNPGYARHETFWVWHLEKKLKSKGNVIFAKRRFR